MLSRYHFAEKVNSEAPISKQHLVRISQTFESLQIVLSKPRIKTSNMSVCFSVLLSVLRYCVSLEQGWLKKNAQTEMAHDSKTGSVSISRVPLQKQI